MPEWHPVHILSISYGGLMINILIVEDESDLANMIKEYVEILGHQVVGISNNGKDALQFASEHSIDLVLMDIRINGDMDGIETAAKLKENYSLALIYVTGNSDDELLHRATKTEPDAFLTKPFKEIDIKTNIEMATYKHKQKRDNMLKSVYNIEFDYDSFLKELGKILKSLRKEKGLSQVVFSKSLGINYRHYQDLEGGKSNLKMETLFKLAKYYNLSIPKLFEKGLSTL